MIRQIETAADLMQWADAVNTGILNIPKCDMQDIYARSQQETIDKLFIESTERALILCSVYNTMSYDEVERLLKVLAHSKVQKQMQLEYAELDERIKEIDNRAAAQANREHEFKNMMKPYHKRLETLKRDNAQLERHIKQLADQEQNAVMNMRAAKQETYEYRAKAEKYDAIRAALI
jgi:chromosome segregation ATPase